MDPATRPSGSRCSRLRSAVRRWHPDRDADGRPSWNLPALFESDDSGVLLAESAVGPGNFGAHLQTDDELTYRIELPYPEEGLSTDPLGEPVASGWTSPWRLIVVSDDLAGIRGSTAMMDFAEASKVSDTAWIRKGLLVVVV